MDVTSAAAPVGPDADVERLFADPDYLRARLRADLPALATLLHERRYPLVALEFIVSYLEHLRKDHLENPQAAVYLESELGAPRRQAEYVGWLEAAGLHLRGKSCLDVGCGNGGLALACVDAGARRVVGVELAEHRVEAGRRMCLGKPIELRRANILEEDLGERFDVVLSTDVLEHVPDPAALLRRIGDHLNDQPGSFASV
jgi:2-polyprenyl-3-methyl-5-hydroxy-6-metoxy-1,4-benzoquinol methylase